MNIIRARLVSLNTVIATAKIKTMIPMTSMILCWVICSSVAGVGASVGDGLVVGAGEVVGLGPGPADGDGDGDGLGVGFILWNFWVISHAPDTLVASMAKLTSQSEAVHPWTRGSAGENPGSGCFAIAFARWSRLALALLAVVGFGLPIVLSSVSVAATAIESKTNLF